MNHSYCDRIYFSGESDISFQQGRVAISILNITGILMEVRGEGKGSAAGTESELYGKESFHRELFSDTELLKLNSFRIAKKQRQWIAGRYGVKKLVQCYSPLNPHLKSIRIDLEEQGAPYLPDYPGLWISITHSGNYAVAALWDEGPVGIDLESFEDRNSEALRRVALSDRETAAYGTDPEELVRLFTIKEAYLKFRGTGFRDSLKQVECLNNSIFFAGKEDTKRRISSWRVDETFILTLLQ